VVNDQAYNAFVDAARIHQTALFTDETLCKQFADASPTNLSASLTTSRGRAIPSGEGNTRSRWFVDKTNFASVIAKDVTSLVKQRQETADSLANAAKEATKEATNAEKRFSAAKRNIKDRMKKREALEKKQQTVSDPAQA
jgi:hypothetical protein